MTKRKITLQQEKECYISGAKIGLHKHHIFGGANRKWSELYGLYVWLRPDWHNMSDYGVHFNKSLDMKLKQYAQAEFEKVYSREEFMRLFGRNYL